MNELMIMLEALLAKAESKSIPNVDFKPNSELFEEAVHIAGLATTCKGEDSDSNKIKTWMNEIAGYLNSEESLEAMEISKVSVKNETLEKIADSLATIIADSNSKLKSIGVTVTEHCKQICDDIDKEISLDPFLSANVNHADIEHTLPTFPFKALSALGPVANLKAYVEGSAGVVNTNESEGLMHRVLDMFAFKNLSPETAPAVALGKEISESIVTSINEANKGILADNINEVMTLLNSQKMLSMLGKKIVQLREAPVLGEACIDLVAKITNWKQVCAKLTDLISNSDIVSADKLTSLSKAIQYLNDACDAYGYYIIFHRNTTFKNTVVMPNKSINPDMVNKYESAGIECIDLCRHIRSRHKSYPIGRNGITLETIVNAKEAIATITDKEDEQIKMRVISDLNEVKRSATTKGFVNILKSLEEDSPSLYTLAKHKASYITTKSVSIEDAAYELIISRYHKNSFVDILHQRLGCEYAKLVSIKKEVNENDASLINASVYAELITEFIVNNFVLED